MNNALLCRLSSGTANTIAVNNSLASAESQVVLLVCLMTAQDLLEMYIRVTKANLHRMRNGCEMTDVCTVHTDKNFSTKEGSSHIPIYESQVVMLLN